MNFFRKSKQLAVAVVAAVAIVAVVTVWSASAEQTPAGAAGAEASATGKQKAVVSAFRKPFKPTRAQRAQRRKVARMVKRSPRSSIAATADARRARAVAVAGYAASVWILPAEDGSVCTFIPDPLDGWGAGCATAEELASGHAMTMLGGAPGTPLGDSAIVAVVVPDGYEEPTVRRPDGSLSVLTATSNVAAAVVQPGVLVRSGRASITVPDPKSSDLSP
jgi:hypothetical protein